MILTPPDLPIDPTAQTPAKGGALQAAPLPEGIDGITPQLAEQTAEFRILLDESRAKIGGGPRGERALEHAPTSAHFGGEETAQGEAFDIAAPAATSGNLSPDGGNAVPTRAQAKETLPYPIQRPLKADPTRVDGALAPRSLPSQPAIGSLETPPPADVSLKSGLPEVLPSPDAASGKGSPLAPLSGSPNPNELPGQLVRNGGLGPASLQPTSEPATTANPTTPIPQLTPAREAASGRVQLPSESPIPQEELPTRPRSELPRDQPLGASSKQDLAKTARDGVDPTLPTLPVMRPIGPKAPSGTQDEPNPAPAGKVQREVWDKVPAKVLGVAPDPDRSLVRSQGPDDIPAKAAGRRKDAAPKDFRFEPMRDRTFDADTAPTRLAVKPSAEGSPLQQAQTPPNPQLATQAPSAPPVPAGEAAPLSSAGPIAEARSEGRTDARPETRPETRIATQIESAIEHLTDAREAGRKLRPELNLRHAEFGSVNVRLEAAGGDIRATLSARDPGFVPAIQAALAERGVAANSEANAGQNQRGQDSSNSGSQTGSQSGAQGQSGTQSEGRYGSFPGSGQASSQPYSEQTELSDEESLRDRRDGRADGSEPGARSGGLFA